MEIKFTSAPDLVREQKHIFSNRESFKFFSCALTFGVTNQREILINVQNNSSV